MKKITVGILLALLPVLTISSAAFAHHTKKDASIKKPPTLIIKSVIA